MLHIFSSFASMKNENKDNNEVYKESDFICRSSLQVLDSI